MASFYDQIPAEIRDLSDSQAVERFAAGADVPARAIAGLTAGQLLAHPVPGTWSIQQIVVHLLDSDLTAGYRMKRTIAENRPRLDAYDETAFARRLGCERLPIAEVCELFRLHRRLLVELLRQQPPEAFVRVALHPEAGELTLGMLVRIYAHHVNHHLRFIEQKRALLGAPLTASLYV